MAHSILAPSSASVWAPLNGCRAMPLMAKRYPELDDGEDAREGEAVHWLGEQFISQIVETGEAKTDAYELSAAPNGVVFDDTMVEAAELYALDVTAIADYELHVEERVECRSIHAECFGTPDAWHFDWSTMTLTVWDFKYGRRWVDEFENWQLIVYVSGILDTLGITGAFDQSVTVAMRIVQPRGRGAGGPIREWAVYDAADLRGYFNQAHTSAHAALDTNPDMVSGKHCRHCPARFDCPAALEASENLYDAATAPKPLELTPDKIGVHLALVQDAIERLEFIQSGLEAQVETLVKSGQPVLNYSTQPTYGRTTWKNPEEMLAIGHLFGLDLHKPGVCTPKQAEKAGLNPQLIDQYTHTPHKGNKVVRQTQNKIRRLFR